MAVVLENVQNAGATGTGGGTLVITKPTGLTAGELMVVFLTAENTLAAVPSETGWTSILNNTTANGDGSYIAAWQKVASAGDAAASNFTFNQPSSYTDANGSFAGILCRISGFNTVTPIGASAGGESTGTNQSHAITITPSANSLLLFMISPQINLQTSAQAITTSNPTWTENVDAVADWTGGTTFDSGYSLASAIRPESTATGNGTFTLSDTGRALSIIVAVSPVAVATQANPTLLLMGVG